MYMKLLVKMLSFFIGNIDNFIEKHCDQMSKEEYEAFMRIKNELDTVPKEKLEEIKKELDSIN